MIYETPFLETERLRLKIKCCDSATTKIVNEDAKISKLIVNKTKFFEIISCY